MDDELKAELAVQELLLRLLMADWRQRHPAAPAIAAEEMETLTLRCATPAGSAALQKWADVLAPSGRRGGSAPPPKS